MSAITLQKNVSYSRGASFKATIDEESRTLEVSFSSERKVRRDFGQEVLDHGPDGPNLSRLNNGAPLLYNHDPKQQIGVVERAWLDASRRQCRAIVRFGRSAFAEEKFRDVMDGVLCNVSMNYMLTRMEHEGGDTYRFYGWEPTEISFVSVPADPSVGVGRSEETAVAAVLSEPEPTIANESRIEIMTRNMKPEHKPEFNPVLGMTIDECRQYSLVRAMRNAAFGKLDGIELEAHRACEARYKKGAQGFFVPYDVLALSMRDTHGLTAAECAAIDRKSRALNTDIATAGGFTVQTNVLASSFIDLLRNAPIMARMGATALSGLTGNVAIPRQATAATASVLDDSATGSSTDSSFGQLALTPKRIFAGTIFQKELLYQSSLDIEAFVRRDLLNVATIKKDYLCLNGVGGAGEPLGLLNTTGVQTVTFSAAATWAKALSFTTKLKTGNVYGNVGNIGFLTTPAVEEKWKTLVKFTSTASPLWEHGQINDYPAETTNQLATGAGGDKMIHCAFEDFIIGDWAAVDIVVDPVTLKKLAQVETVINMWFDCGLRHSTSAVISTDAANQ